MSRTWLLTCFATCLMTAACHRGATPTVEPQANAGTSAEAAQAEDSCPGNVPATTVTVVNTKTGVAMFFTTTPSNVDEVRRRVAEAAKVDTTGPRPPPPEESEMDPAPGWAFGQHPELVPLQAKAEEVSDGAALVLTPLTASDIEQLRAYAHSYANKMKLGRCPVDFMKMPGSPGAQNAVLPPAGKLG